ncbi:AAA family ATPase [Prescottella equi]|uniref:AAA family ATPase n=1 Tax=Rhodococcus hoagii TaxID=43767 RepID=UPI000AE5FED1|nr:AAA family ATPase [Prescottella equi]BDE58663.1 hypothetical protein REA19_16790 [Prescottella equi]
MEELEWTGDDFADIAREQTRMEESAARAGSPVLICDTDAFATTVWERRYLGTGSAHAWAGVADRPAIYLLTDHIGVPFVQDGIRDGEHIRADEHIRAEMTRWFEDALTATGRSWVLLTDPLSERVDLAVRVVDLALVQRSSFGAPM